MPKNDYIMITPPIKKGGQGIIYKCKDKYGKILAMKILNLNKLQVDIDVQKSRKQGEILKKFNHKNVIKLYDYFEDSFNDVDEGISMKNVLYIIMEYIQSGDLEDFIENNPEIRLEVILKIYSDIKSGLDYVHSQSIVHRDISTNNILLTKDWTPIITDFGIATDTKGKRYTKTYLGHGKQMYRSFQLLRAGFVSKQNDYWALGIVMLELAFGKSIYDIRKDSLISHPCQDITFPKKQINELKKMNKNVGLIPIIESLLTREVKDRRMLDLQSSPQISNEVKNLYRSINQKEKKKIPSLPVFVEIKKKTTILQKKVFNENQEVQKIKNKTLFISSKISNSYYSNIFQQILDNMSINYNCKISDSKTQMIINYIFQNKANRLEVRTKTGILWDKLEGISDLETEYQNISSFIAKSYTAIEKYQNK